MVDPCGEVRDVGMLQLHMVPTSGDATLLRFVEGDHEVNILVDGGNRKDDCIDYLMKLGVERLDLVIASHLDQDHTMGLRRVTDEMRVDEIWITDISPLIEPAADSLYMRFCLAGAAVAVAGARLKGKLAVYEGYETQLGPFYLQVLSPPKSLHRYLRLPETVKRILRSPKGSTIRAYVNELLMDELDSLDRDTPESIVQADERLSEVIDRFAVEVRQLDDIPGIIDADDLDPEYWREVDQFHEAAQGLFNDISIVVRVTYSHRGTTKRFLFPGDLTNWTIMLARHADLIRQCVLKVPHHGSEIEYHPEDSAAFCLSRHARAGFAGGLPRPWHHLGEEYYYVLRESLRGGTRPLPFSLRGFPALPPPIKPGFEGIYAWLSPERALVYPRQSSRSLPKLGVRNAIVNASEAMSCTLSQTRVDSGQHAPSDACIDCFHCVDASEPIIFEW